MHKTNSFQYWGEWELNIYHPDPPCFANKTGKTHKDFIHVIFLMSKA